MFREAATTNSSTDLEEYTVSINGFISNCIVDITVIKTMRSNQKPWMTAEVCALLRARDIDIKAGDKEALSIARATQARAIRDAKQAHSQKVQGHFRDSRDTRQLGRTSKSSPTIGQHHSATGIPPCSMC